ncbi:hypothetical protein Bca52824_013835 [Brassica carinata]|uniref:Uncharacterized protein n=1 Tax=Brassica carinata TaxID=52824 RepID=A0A8X8B487_BRACI|nr:hypothetical protein Bca52824_013835 [Brassica carinata]
MRNLLRSLKPSSQVCAFSGLQDDERVSLKFFYWSDLSGRLMKRRGNRISRAGQLRDALKVLTRMQRAGFEPDLLILQYSYCCFRESE